MHPDNHHDAPAHDDSSADNVADNEHIACHYEHPATRDDNCTACFFSCLNSAAEHPIFHDPFASFLRAVAIDCIDGGN